MVRESSRQASNPARVCPEDLGTLQDDRKVNKQEICPPMTLMNADEDGETR